MARLDVCVRPAEADAVLVLCSDPNLRMRVTHWLAEASRCPMQATDGYDASQMLDRETVYAIVTDRLLPPWPGLDPLVLLRKSRRDLSVIYVGNGDAGTDNLARAAGATHVLTCPLRRRSVLKALPQRSAIA